LLKISSGDLLIINATVIIGLLVLLTFSSVASPFGQEERSAFFADWYDVQIEINSGDRFLSECDELLNNATKRMETFNAALLVDMEKLEQPKYTTRGEPSEFQGNYDKQIIGACVFHSIEKSKLTNELEELNRWGTQMKYLEYNKTDSSQLVESQYHKDLASGPYTANMINLAMIMPFLFSAIVDTIISSRKEKTEVASNIGIVLMVAGFVVVVVGLTLIGISFYNAASPFL